MSNTLIVILIPVYNDWCSFDRLVKEIDLCAQDFKQTCIQIIAIDDGSIQIPDNQIEGHKIFHNIQKINILRLARNLGHQKAIALGLAYISASVQNDLVIVMDADGEDQPRDILGLLNKSSECPNHIIFARRTRRSEGMVFRAFYFLYKVFFKLLTGSQIAFGNFCLIPHSVLNRVVHLPEIWNHFAAGVMRANIPWTSIPTKRGCRYAGKSSMNFVALVIHGLSAISVYIEILTVRLMLAATFIIGMSIISFFILLYIKYMTALAIPGWATNVTIGIVIIMFQAILLLALLAFLSLHYRSNKLFIPIKDYQDYLLNLE